MDELRAASRHRTLLSLLVRLEHYERVGVARREAPPSEEYWARRMTHDPARDAVQEVLVLADDEEQAVVALVLDDLRPD